MTVRFRFQVCDEQKVYDIERLVGLIDDDSPPAGRTIQKFGVVDADLATVGQVNDEWFERLGFPKVAKLVGGHVTILAISLRKPLATRDPTVHCAR